MGITAGALMRGAMVSGTPLSVIDPTPAVLPVVQANVGEALADNITYFLTSIVSNKNKSVHREMQLGIFRASVAHTDFAKRCNILGIFELVCPNNEMLTRHSYSKMARMLPEGITSGVDALIDNLRDPVWRAEQLAHLRADYASVVKDGLASNALHVFKPVLQGEGDEIAIKSREETTGVGVCAHHFAAYPDFDMFREMVFVDTFKFWPGLCPSTSPSADLLASMRRSFIGRYMQFRAERQSDFIQLGIQPGQYSDIEVHQFEALRTLMEKRPYGMHAVYNLPFEEWIGIKSPRDYIRVLGRSIARRDNAVVQKLLITQYPGEQPAPFEPQIHTPVYTVAFEYNHLQEAYDFEKTRAKAVEKKLRRIFGNCTHKRNPGLFEVRMPVAAAGDKLDIVNAWQKDPSIMRAALWALILLKIVWLWGYMSAPAKLARFAHR